MLSSINQGLQTSLSNVSQQQTALQAELATYSATLTAQYNAMDTAVASLKETANLPDGGIQSEPVQLQLLELFDLEPGQRHARYLRAT